MVLTKEELIQAIRDAIGESTTDAAIALLENVSDTTDYYISRDSANWEEKFTAMEAEWADKYARQAEDYEGQIAELDAMWRRRYIDRFNGDTEGEVIEDPEDQEEEVIDETPKTYESLFEG